MPMSIRGNGMNKLGIYLSRINKGAAPAMERALEGNANYIAGRLRAHIDKQDLDWTPLAKSTVRRKKSDKIYVETGWLRKNLGVRIVRGKRFTVYIGASPWKRHAPSGLNFNALMTMLEFGTDQIPPRPLILPTMEEVKPIIKKNLGYKFRNYILEGRR